MDDKEKSIIGIMQNMLSKGETAESIISNLKQMGIAEEQAKTLLMLAQTNTLAVLKGDVKQMVNDEFSFKYPEFENTLTEKLNVKTDANKERVKQEVLLEMNKQNEDFQKKQIEYSNKLTNISVEQDAKIEVVKNKLNEVATNYDKLALGSTKSLFAMRIASVAIGIIIAIILIIKLFTLMPGYSIDYLFFYIILGIISAVLIVLGLM
jgi:hypothetical protein